MTKLGAAVRGLLGQKPRRSGLAAAVVALLAAGALALVPIARSHAAPTPARGAGSSRLSLPSPGAAWVPIARPSPVRALVPKDPFKSAAMRHFLAARSGNVTAGVYDVASHTTFLYHPGDDEQTASIVKVNILALLLAQAQADHEPLSSADAATATGMIEASDNDDAQDLFDEEGGASAIAAFDKRLAMTQTTPNWAWGLTETDPRDQLRLLRRIVLPNHVLRYDYRETELQLMEHVIGEDYWGITAGPARGVAVALKNGWLPVPGGWQINSIGMVRGHGRFYLIAVMTNGNDTEGYGIDTIEGISRLVYGDLRHPPPARPRGTTGPSGVSGSSGPSGGNGASGASGPTPG